jgi:RHS repeat-associated protein
MAPGAPSGSYVLSGLDTVNFSNGHLNLNLPLFRLQGRGATQLPINVPFEFVQWRILGVVDSVTCTPGFPCVFSYKYQVLTTDWNPFPPGFGAATLVQRASGDGCTEAGDGVSGWVIAWQNTLSRLTFTEPDGTEHELWDTSTGGQARAGVNYNLANGYDRGTTFVSHDGSQMTFTSAANIYDPAGCAQITAEPMTGKLVLRDGTAYQFTNGRATMITDRNGNQVQFAYNNSNGYMGPPSSITDSLGHSITISPGSSGGHGVTTVTYPGTGGTQETITIKYNNVANLLRDAPYVLPNYQDLISISGSNGVTNLIANGQVTFAQEVVSEIDLPDSQSYKFQYSIYGTVARIALPTGGTIEYDYQSTPAYSPLSGGPADQKPVPYTIQCPVIERREYTTTETAPRTLTNKGSYSGKTTYMPVANPDYPNTNTRRDVQHFDASSLSQGKESHYYYPFSDPANGASYSGWQSGKEYKTETYDTSASTLLRSNQNNFAQRDCTAGPPCWFTSNWPLQDANSPEHDSRLISETTTLSDAFASTANVSQRTYQYDQYNNRTDVQESSYGVGSAGALARDTQTVYETASAYLSRNILGLPFTEKVLDGGGNQIALTTYGYDESALATSPASAVGHDDANYSSGFLVGRGNVTSVTRWLSDPITGVSPTPPIGSYTYDILGNVTSIQDVRGVRHDYGYADAVLQGSSCGASTSIYYAYPTSVTSYPIPGSTSNPMTANACYDYSIGKPTGTKDLNGNTTTYAYETGLLDRLLSVNRPDNGTTAFTYTDTPGSVSVETKSSLLTSGDNKLDSQVFYDGLGRQAASVRYETVDIWVATCYDSRGRAWATSIPAVGSSQPLCPSVPSSPAAFSGFTATLYDSMGRARFVTTPDGATSETRYAGPVTLSIDPSGKTRQAQTDSLGRLIQVIENQKTWNGAAVGVSSEPALATNYAFDTLDDLSVVCQGGSITNGSCSGSQPRQFLYDSLKRLVKATNPENGALYYNYDLSNNLTTRKMGSTSQLITSISYDGLNRPTNKSYSGGVATPAVTFCYDGLPSAGICPTSGTAGFVGRLTYAGNSQSSTTYNLFDAMGRVTASTQSTGAGTYPFSYTYALNGALASTTYPSGRQVSYSLDTAGRVSAVTGTLSGAQTNYVTGVQYKPWNAIQQFNLGNGLAENWTYNNSRMQPLSVTAIKGSNTLLTLNMWYCTGTSPAQDCATNNGNVMQTWAGPSATPAYQQTFAYDSLNRLTSAAEGSAWSQAYGYDAYGNRWASGTGPGIDSTTPATSAWYDATTNHMVNTQLPVAYDDAGAGNLKTLSGYVFAYDGENRMVTSTLNSIATTYTYDGQGRRVQKSTGATATTFVYDAQGQLAAEYSTQAPTVAGTQYLTADHLGSTRLTTDASGNPVSYHDYVPFGEEIPATVNGRGSLYGAADGVNKKFTGQYRDTETQSSAMPSGLDYFGARYFSGAQGRFTTPDWSMTPQPVPYAELSDPQTLNLYSYVRNNPLSRADADGHCDSSAKAAANTACHNVSDLHLTDAYTQQLKNAEGEAGGKPIPAYKDVGDKHHTVGWGHVDDSVPLGTKVDEKQAQQFFDADTAKGLQAVRDVLSSNGNHQWSYGEFTALVDLTYQVGTGILSEKSSPNLMKAIKDGDYDAGSKELKATRINGAPAPPEMKQGMEKRSAMRQDIWNGKDPTN